MRCLYLVATWTIYSKALQRRVDSTTEINGLAPVGAPPQLALVTYITQSSLLVARQFVTLLDFEITVAWKVAQGLISQRLHRGGMQTISSTTLRFQETWCRNATLASLRMTNGSHQCILPLATIIIPPFKQEDWRILDVGGGLHTILLAMLISGRKIDTYWPVEADEHNEVYWN